MATPVFGVICGFVLAWIVGTLANARRHNAVRFDDRALEAHFAELEAMPGRVPLSTPEMQRAWPARGTTCEPGGMVDLGIFGVGGGR